MTWREVDALADAQRIRIRRDDARTGLLRWTMACLWSTSKPELEDFLPSDDDEQPAPDPDNMTLKIGGAMQKLGAKTPQAPAVRTYSAADLEFIERVNKKLLGAQA